MALPLHLPSPFEGLRALCVTWKTPIASSPRAPRSEVSSRGAPGIVRAVVSRLEPELERELCMRAKAGDRVALGKLLRAYGPLLYRAVLLPRLGSESRAQDALSETYTRVVERFSQYEWQECGVYPWLRVVAMRIALDQLRSRRRETLFEPDDIAEELEHAERLGPAAPDAEVLAAHDLEAARQKVQRALASINPRYALAIRLRVLEERTREEVARELDVSVSTFDVVLHRAMNALKKVLSKESAVELEEVRS